MGAEANDAPSCRVCWQASLGPTRTEANLLLYSCISDIAGGGSKVSNLGSISVIDGGFVSRTSILIRSPEGLRKMKLVTAGISLDEWQSSNIASTQCSTASLSIVPAWSIATVSCDAQEAKAMVAEGVDDGIDSELQLANVHTAKSFTKAKHVRRNAILIPNSSRVITS